MSPMSEVFAAAVFQLMGSSHLQTIVSTLSVLISYILLRLDSDLVKCSTLENLSVVAKYAIKIYCTCIVYQPRGHPWAPQTQQFNRHNNMYMYVCLYIYIYIYVFVYYFDMCTYIYISRA